RDDAPRDWPCQRALEGPERQDRGGTTQVGDRLLKADLRGLELTGQLRVQVSPLIDPRNQCGALAHGAVSRRTRGDGVVVQRGELRLPSGEILFDLRK